MSLDEQVMPSDEQVVTGRPSMADVGRLAQVSSQTVSRYFTGVGYVREDTRERIAAAIEQLGYRRNHSARNFRRQRTDTLGVLSMGSLNYGSAEILTGLSLAARGHGMTLTITQLDPEENHAENHGEVRRVLDHLMSVPVDGILVLTPFSDVAGLLSELAGATPMITIADKMDGLDAVASAHSGAGADQATTHLLTLGHTDVLCVAGPAGRNEANERVRGYREAMNRAGAAPRVISVADDWTAVSGFRSAQAAAGEAFTAVFAANDEIALGFMHGMALAGRHAPHDYAIAGIDDMPSAAFFSPPLTSVRLDFRQLGHVAVDEVLRQIRTGEPARHCGVEPQLVVRESSSPGMRDGTRR